MNLKDYLLLMLEQKYRLTPEDGTVLVAIVSAIRHREIPVLLKACPRLDSFKESGMQGIYEATKLNAAWFNFVVELQHAKSQEDVYALLNALMDHSYTGVSKMALVLTSEWQYVPRQLMAMEAIEEEPERKLEAAYNGWLATGMYTAMVPSTGEGNLPKEAVFDLTKNDQGEPPVEVLLARVIHAAYDSATMQVVPERLENVTKLLAQLFMHERNHHNLQLKQVVEQHLPAPTSAARIWPTDDNHWIYDPEMSKLQVAWPLRMGDPKRDLMREAIDRAAKFAVSRASAMGSSRIFNIEAFVYNVILGLIGDGATVEGDFDWKAYLGLSEDPAVVEEPAIRQLRSVLPNVSKELPAKTLEVLRQIAFAPEAHLDAAIAAMKVEPKKPAKVAPVKPAAKAK